MSGRLGVLANNGHFRIFELKKDYVEDLQTSSEGSSEVEHTDKYVQYLHVRHSHTIEQPHQRRYPGSKETDNIISFEFTNLYTQNGRLAQSSFEAIRKSVYMHSNAVHRP